MKWLSLVLAVPLLASAAAESSPPATLLSSLDRAPDWLNRRVESSDLAGRVVVLDVFTVDCINCRNVIPTLRSLYAANRERGLRVIGIHAPETPAERSRNYVKQSLARQGIVWPVAIDNDFMLWHSYGVTAWPTQLFFDPHGRLRKTIVGDSQDDEVRATAETLLKEGP